MHSRRAGAVCCLLNVRLSAQRSPQKPVLHPDCAPALRPVPVLLHPRVGLRKSVNNRTSAVPAAREGLPGRAGLVGPAVAAVLGAGLSLIHI